MSLTNGTKMTDHSADEQDSDTNELEYTWQIIRSYQLSPEDVISQVTETCRRHGVRELYLFGSYAAGNPTRQSVGAGQGTRHTYL